MANVRRPGAVTCCGPCRWLMMIRASFAAGTRFMRRRGWHIPGLCGTFGSAIILANLVQCPGAQRVAVLKTAHGPVGWRRGIIYATCRDCLRGLTPGDTVSRASARTRGQRWRAQTSVAGYLNHGDLSCDVQSFYAACASYYRAATVREQSYGDTVRHAHYDLSPESAAYHRAATV